MQRGRGAALPPNICSLRGTTARGPHGLLCLLCLQRRLQLELRACRPHQLGGARYSLHTRRFLLRACCGCRARCLYRRVLRCTRRRGQGGRLCLTLRLCLLRLLGLLPTALFKQGLVHGLQLVIPRPVHLRDGEPSRRLLLLLLLVCSLPACAAGLDSDLQPG